jgi:hypothetical protein
MKRAAAVSLVVLAISAMGCIGSAAPASAVEFHASTVGASVSGVQATLLKWTTTGTSQTCSSVKFTGKTAAVSSPTQQLHPEFSECTSFGFISSVFNTLGCQFLLHAQTGTMDLQSCASGALVVTSSSAFGRCVWEVPNQAGINGLTWATEGTSPSRDILWTLNATNIKTKVTTSTGICPLTVGEHTNTTLTGTVTLKAASGEIWYA